jgi:phosphoglycolate phosphatase-like HAD superfamily hydrolase
MLRVVSQRCFLFDIDGTLADNGHRVHFIQKQPKDWDGFFGALPNDPLIVHVAEVLRALDNTHNRIVYVSGRPSNYRSETQNWLHRHGLPVSPLYMRAAGDHRNDDIVKIELLEQIRRDGYEPALVFDDRDRVVKAWRQAGVPCAQVAEGSF